MPVIHQDDTTAATARVCMHFFEDVLSEHLIFLKDSLSWSVLFPDVGLVSFGGNTGCNTKN